MKYKIVYSNGITYQCQSSTLRGAKISATRNLTYGVSVTIFEVDTPVCHKEFWQSGTKFGWSGWQDAE